MTALGETVGDNRADAIYRIAFVLVLVVGTVLFPPAALLFGLIWLLAVIAAILWFVVDVLWQLIFNASGWTMRSRGAAMWLERLVFWPIDLTTWTIFGTGDFPWLP